VERFERELLVRRAALGVPSTEITLSDDDSAPERGHKTGRIGVSAGRMEGTGIQQLSLRAALHDLSEDPRGYIPNSQLEMAHLVVRRDDRAKKTYVDKMTLVDILSLSPMDRWVRHPSWKFFMGWDNARDLPLAPEHRGHVTMNGGTGAAWDNSTLGQKSFYTFIDGDAGTGGVFRRNYRLGVGATTGILWELSSKIRLRVEVGWMRHFSGEIGSFSHVSATPSVRLGRNWDTRAVIRRTGRRRECLVSLNRYL
jgi:hypothetical protein